MRYLVVCRVISNGGDHLIAKKMVELLGKLSPENEVVLNDGSKDIDLDYIHSFDRLVIGGGPVFENRIFNFDAYPVLKTILNVNIPIYIFGAGWFGQTGAEETILNYKFNEDALKVFNKVISSGGFLGGRDYLTTRVLKNNGFDCVMTGCPVWYDYDFLGSVDINQNVNKEIKKIIISDPGITKEAYEQEMKSKQTIELIDFVINKFPTAEIMFTFNNGIFTKYSTNCNVKIRDYLDTKNIQYFDLANSWEGFKIYDNCDLHIGYRVHSHIYALSRRIPSVLVEEDARGYGVNHAFGLENLPSYDVEEMKKENAKQNLKENKYLLKQLDFIVDEMIDSNYLKIINAFRFINETYKDKVEKFFM